MGEYQFTPREQALRNKWSKDRPRANMLAGAKRATEKRAGKEGRKKNHQKNTRPPVTIRRITD